MKHSSNISKISDGAKNESSVVVGEGYFICPNWLYIFVAPGGFMMNDLPGTHPNIKIRMKIHKSNKTILRKVTQVFLIVPNLRCHERP